METIVVNGTLRTEFGKKATRALRKAGNIPCNLYGGADTVSFYAPVAEFRKLIYTPDFRIAEINVDGKKYKAILKEGQFDPVKDDLMHLDFQELVDTVKVKVSVPLRLLGTPRGTATGGKMEQVLRKLTIMALPKHLVTAVELDVTDLDMGGIKRIRDIKAEGITFLLSSSNPVARIAIPRAAKADAAAAPAKK